MGNLRAGQSAPLPWVGKEQECTRPPPHTQHSSEVVVLCHLECSLEPLHVPWLPNCAALLSSFLSPCPRRTTLLQAPQGEVLPECPSYQGSGGELGDRFAILGFDRGTNLLSSILKHVYPELVSRFTGLRGDGNMPKIYFSKI